MSFDLERDVGTGVDSASGACGTPAPPVATRKTDASNHLRRTGGQGEAVRVPFADATLVPVPGGGHSDEILGSLVTLSDVMCTGHHAAVSAGVKDGAGPSIPPGVPSGLSAAKA
jgi:hypothetical protein